MLRMQGVGGSAGGHTPFGGVPPAPAAQVAGERRGRPDVSASLAEREGSGHT
jgi:hypothetical protein